MTTFYVHFLRRNDFIYNWLYPRVSPLGFSQHIISLCPQLKAIDRNKEKVTIYKVMDIAKRYRRVLNFIKKYQIVKKFRKYQRKSKVVKTISKKPKGGQRKSKKLERSRISEESKKRKDVEITQKNRKSQKKLK